MSTDVNCWLRFVFWLQRPIVPDVDRFFNVWALLLFGDSLRSNRFSFSLYGLDIVFQVSPSAWDRDADFTMRIPSADDRGTSNRKSLSFLSDSPIERGLYFLSMDLLKRLGVPQ
jgi:hypothetical protein